MSTIKNCPDCGKIFSPTITEDVCIECNKKREEEYNIVYKLLRKTPGLSIQEVSSATGVSVKKITDFIKSGRISLSVLPKEEKFLCKGCGKEIKVKAKLCKNCAEEFKSKLKKR